ncbi:MAG: hypothetical protein ACM3X4_01595 [Ignavibacteriales bacterium]
MKEYSRVAFEPDQVRKIAHNVGIEMTLFETQDFLERRESEIADTMYEAGLSLIRRLLCEENEE